MENNRRQEDRMRKLSIKIALPLLEALAISLPILIAAADPAASGKKFAIVFKNTGNPYGDKQMSGFKTGIEELGGEAILRAPDQPTAEAQIQIIEQLIAQKVASICIVGNDYDAL